MQVAGRGHPFELSSPGQVNSSMPQMVGHIIGQGLPSFPVAPFYSIENKIRQGPLNIWTEHSDCQIHRRGDSKTSIALLIPNSFLIFYKKYFSMDEGMTQFVIFHTLPSIYRGP